MDSAIDKLTKDLKIAARMLSRDEARFLVSIYYRMQDNRVRSSAQVRSLAEAEQPNAILQWFASQDQTLENRVKKILEYYTDDHPVGSWMRQVDGIGPVIAAGLLAHIDIHKAPTVGHIWSYAGLNPLQKREKGKKLPWNFELKTLCWNLGECIVKFKNKEHNPYGKLYDERKAYEQGKNEAGDYSGQAAELLATKNYSKSTPTYKALVSGKLSDGHIHARAKRYAVKQFLSDLHDFWRCHEGLPVPLPYPIAILGHAHLRANLNPARA